MKHRKNHDYRKPKKLPTFKGFTVDNRLREFRRLKLGELPEFVPFDSEKGIALLNEFQRGL